ncbi:MAG TPA: hypoxanthine phosphoribosyltransferase [Bacteroidales bacterium]|nr:MAG: hypoxanthine phosphoribosyltransferase [Bacteroidetes bacterium GWF2_33_38]OFY70163.1 MAG: hypoxanthine phosphoribosyltransferase [Bacteroidetes bacterium RIFOXYA12_FULL_33_9]OFY89275.1 MAG: hypoxanthine phosphoribosyltransferase [Bacteroidetes bacterium RIFOXYA2_FULL_33_7]HBF87160.1 hypoxanthine phosphoribosyltransferase [Bacteroidales bacterium]
MKKVKILDKEFEVSIPSDEIQDAIQKIADRMNVDFAGKEIIFLGILNGAFMFASDLFKKINVDCRITFLKLASYEGTRSTGTLKRLIGLNEDVSGATVVILEDIVDTGHTIVDIVKQLKGYEPKEIKVATMFLKPDVYDKDVKIDYIGMEIPNDFIVGYGLDYDGYGRNLADIYTLIK